MPLDIVPQFIPGREYRRSELHDLYGGSRQSGICPSKRYPLIFLFTGSSGHRYGYNADGFQPDGLFAFTGEGQLGPMRLTKGNLAILNAAPKGIRIHLFEQVRKAWVRYIDEVFYVNHGPAIAPDRDGKDREVIVFQFALAGTPSSEPAPDLQIEEDLGGTLWHMPMAQLRETAKSGDPYATRQIFTPADRKIQVRKRSAAVKIYALRRANGICEACGQPAPFRTKEGQPYLEVHHIRRLADNGPDDPASVAGLCPTCHRRIHHADDGAEYNALLGEAILSLEARSYKNRE